MSWLYYIAPEWRNRKAFTLSPGVYIPVIPPPSTARSLGSKIGLCSFAERGGLLSLSPVNNSDTSQSRASGSSCMRNSCTPSVLRHLLYCTCSCLKRCSRHPWPSMVGGFYVTGESSDGWELDMPNWKYCFIRSALYPGFGLRWIRSLSLDYWVPGRNTSWLGFKPRGSFFSIASPSTEEPPKKHVKNMWKSSKTTTWAHYLLHHCEAHMMYCENTLLNHWLQSFQVV